MKDAKFDFSKPQPGMLPEQNGSLNVGWRWAKDKVTGEPKLVLDANHANRFGNYLGSSVFYEMIFGESVESNSFLPQGMTEADATDLRFIAHKTVEEIRVGGTLSVAPQRQISHR